MTDSQAKSGWQVWLVYLRPEALRMLFLGFSAGLPVVLLASTLGLKLAEAGIEITSITYLSWIGIAYSFKWAWAPLVDKLPIFFLTHWLGRRRSWMLLAQAGIITGLIGIAFTDVQSGLAPLVGFALLVAFSSATQDIALDAYRIESAQREIQAALIAMYQMGFRFAMIWAGAGALWIAARVQQDAVGYDAYAWQVAYLIMAGSVLVGVIAVLFSPEKKRPPLTPAAQATALAHQLQPLPLRLEAWVQSGIVAPFADFLLRYKEQAVIILALIALYRIADIVMGTVSTPFYNFMGYTKDEIAAISKTFGLIITLFGGVVGGAMVMRSGIYRILMLGAVLSAATNILFALLALFVNDLHLLGFSFDLGGWHFECSGKVMALIVVISMDNLSAGIASAAFLGYLSSLTNIEFSGTQYALFTSLMSLIPRFLGGFSGEIVQNFSYPTFFMSTALLGLPVLVLVWFAARIHEPGKVVMLDKGAGELEKSE